MHGDPKRGAKKQSTIERVVSVGLNSSLAFGVVALLCFAFLVIAVIGSCGSRSLLVDCRGCWFLLLHFSSRSRSFLVVVVPIQRRQRLQDGRRQGTQMTTLTTTTMITKPRCSAASSLLLLLSSSSGGIIVIIVLCC